MIDTSIDPPSQGPTGGRNQREGASAQSQGTPQYFAHLDLDRLDAMPIEVIDGLCRGFLFRRRDPADAVIQGKVLEYIQQSGRHRELDLDFDSWVQGLHSTKDPDRISSQTRMYQKLAGFEVDKVAGLRINARCLEAITQGPMQQDEDSTQVRRKLLELGQGIRHRDAAGIKQIRETAVKAQQMLEDGGEVAQVLKLCEAEARLPAEQQAEAECQEAIVEFGQGTGRLVTLLKRVSQERQQEHIRQLKEQVEELRERLEAWEPQGSGGPDSSARADSAQAEQGGPAADSSARADSAQAEQGGPQAADSSARADSAQAEQGAPQAADSSARADSAQAEQGGPQADSSARADSAQAEQAAPQAADSSARADSEQAEQGAQGGKLWDENEEIELDEDELKWFADDEDDEGDPEGEALEDEEDARMADYVADYQDAGEYGYRPVAQAIVAALPQDEQRKVAAQMGRIAQRVKDPLFEEQMWGWWDRCRLEEAGVDRGTFDLVIGELCGSHSEADLFAVGFLLWGKPNGWTEQLDKLQCASFFLSRAVRVFLKNYWRPVPIDGGPSPSAAGIDRESLR